MESFRFELLTSRKTPPSSNASDVKPLGTIFMNVKRRNKNAFDAVVTTESRSAMQAEATHVALTVPRVTLHYIEDAKPTKMQ